MIDDFVPINLDKAKVVELRCFIANPAKLSAEVALREKYGLFRLGVTPPGFPSLYSVAKVFQPLGIIQSFAQKKCQSSKYLHAEFVNPGMSSHTSFSTIPCGGGIFSTTVSVSTFYTCVYAMREFV